MSPPLSVLEERRQSLREQIAQLGDFRAGSLVSVCRRCGKPSCHCARPEDPGHGPDLRLTYKVQGKTVTEALPTAAARRKTEREIREFRKYRQLSRAFVEVNGQICRQRPILQEAESTAEEKKRQKPFSGRWRRK